MERNLIFWWKELNHNHKKNLIANFDFFKNNIAINPYNELYSQYKIAFGKGIRERLDTFTVTERSLSELISIRKLVINHNSFTDFSHLSSFADLEGLYFSNHTVESLDTLKNVKLKTLTLSCSKLKSLNGVERYEKLKKLALIYCYDLDDLNCLRECSSLALLDLEICGKLVLFDQLDHIDEINLHKNLIYPNEIEHTLYKWQRHENIGSPYDFSEDETQFIMKKADRKQKNNYCGLIMSNRYKVIVKGFSEWTLKRAVNIPALPIKSDRGFWLKIFGHK